MEVKIMWCLLVVMWAGAYVRAEISKNMNNLSRNLQQEMADVMEMATVNYSAPIINATYYAKVEFDMRAMGPLYNSTHMVIDFIVNKDAYPEGMVSVADGHVEVASLKDNWRTLAAHYAGPAAVLLAALLLAAVLPLAGLFWCCCQWCRSGRRRRPFDRKYDACLKALLAILLIAILTLFLFGVVCAFATDSQVESGAAGAGEPMRAAVRDVRTFLHATAAHARHLLVTNYRELAATLNALLFMSGRTVTDKLHEFNRASSVTTLNRLVQRLDSVHADLRSVHNLTALLRTRADTLNSGLRKLKHQLEHTLANCSQPKCVALHQKYNFGRLTTKIQYSHMPDVLGLLENVSSLLEGDIRAQVGEGQRVFENIQTAIRSSVNRHIPDLQASIDSIGKQLESLSEKISSTADNISVQVGQQAALVDRVDELHSQYGPYRRYAGLAAASVPLLMSCFVAWGLACGVYGKRPDAYGAADCCNKGHGARALLWGVGCMFLLGALVALALAAYFLVGVASTRLLCDPLTEPRDNRVFSMLEQVVQLERQLYHEQKDPDFNLTSVLVHCHANHTIYKTLQLWRRYDIEQIRSEASREVEARIRSLRPAVSPASILRDGAREQLQALADSGLGDFDFERILNALETNMTSLALDSLLKQLEATAAGLTSPKFAREASSLRAAAEDLRKLLDDVVTPMLEYTDTLNTTAIRLRDSLRFNHRSLRDAIAYLMRETADAELFLNTQGPERLQNITHEYGSVIATAIDEYLARVAHAAEHDVGRCGPLSAAYNATRDALCTRLLLPANGYWISLSWCVLLFVPLAVVCVRLARLYRTPDAYPGPRAEAEYLYDAYADRDNVPLANAYKADKRGGRGRAREPEPEPRAALPPHDAHHARRYNDMAPKHWEEGPPRYHGPTEYERPPPYYYPGPDDRQ